MKAMVVHEAGKGFQFERRTTPEPGRGQVRVDVHACGICHSDHFVADALWPELTLPRVPGHEVAGVVSAVGEGVDRLKVGDRVGIGWHDGTCDPCLHGYFVHCENQDIAGITIDGGYADMMIAPAVACARVTTLNARRNSDAQPGEVVGIQGLGGQGHLGVQFARAMGFKTVAISRGASKKAFAKQLGAHHYVDTISEDLGDRLAAPR